MKGVLAFLAVTLATAGQASGYLKAGPNVMPGAHNVLQGGTVVNTMATSLTAAYSFRKVREAYAGSAVKLRRTTGGTLDVGFTAAGDFDTTAAATFCNATTCFLDTWYDQSGNARHAVQATTALQPAYIADCGNGRPCARTTAATQKLESAGSLTTATGKGTLNGVAMRQATAATNCHIIGLAGGTGLQLFINSGNEVWAATDTVAYLAPAAADGAWHSGTGVINGAASVMRLDTTEVTNTLAGKITTGPVAIASQPGAGAICNYVEMAYWDNYFLTADERIALSQNQRDYWAPLPLDSFATPAAAYSMRRLRSAYSGPAIRLRRASDNAEQDINFLGFTSFTGAPIDTVAATGFCAATTCSVAKWYDQSGNARDLPPAGTVALIFNCLGTQPCVRTSAAASYMLLGGQTFVAKGSMSAVANRPAGTGQCNFTRKGPDSLLSDTTANNWTVTDFTSGQVIVAAADNAWHAGVGVIDSPSATVARIDTTDTTGTALTGAGGAANIQVLSGADATTCQGVEHIMWDGYALTAGERTALTANQKNFWGF